MPPTKPPQPSNISPRIVAVATNYTEIQAPAAVRVLDTNQFTPDPTKRYEVTLSAAVNADAPGNYSLVWNDGTNEQQAVLVADVFQAGEQHLGKSVLLNAGDLPATPMVIGLISFGINFTLSPNSRLCQIVVKEWPQ